MADASEHLSRLIKALTEYRDSNRRPAIDEPGNDFEKVVNDHYQLDMLMAEVKKAMKPLETDERKIRDGIAASLNAYYRADGRTLNEGVNNYELTNGRKLKYTYAVERKIEPSMIAVARAKFEAAGDKLGTFDDVLRVKYELEAKPWKKLINGGEAFLACSEMIVAKDKAPTLEVD